MRCRPRVFARTSRARHEGIPKQTPGGPARRSSDAAISRGDQSAPRMKASPITPQQLSRNSLRRCPAVPRSRPHTRAYYGACGGKFAVVAPIVRFGRRERQAYASGLSEEVFLRGGSTRARKRAMPCERSSRARYRSRRRVMIRSTASTKRHGRAAARNSARRARAFSRCRLSRRSLVSRLGALKSAVRQ